MKFHTYCVLCLSAVDENILKVLRIQETLQSLRRLCVLLHRNCTNISHLTGILVEFVVLMVCQISTIVSHIPHLDFLNLSMNPLSGVELEPSMANVFSRVRQLVLINTQVSWDTVHTLTQNTPE